MSQYEEDADRLAEHDRNTCDDPFCQICDEEEAAEDKAAKNNAAVSQ